MRGMAIMMIVMLAAYVAANYYIYVRLSGVMPQMPTMARVAVATLYWFMSVALILSFLARDILPDTPQRILFAVGSVWLVFVLYMTLATLLADAIHYLYPALRGGVWYALALTIVILIGGYINYRHPRIERITIHSPKYDAAKPLRIALISDIHLGYGTDRADLARYVDMLNAERPDVVLIAGDLIDNTTRPVAKENMLAEFERIEAPYGIFMAAGNHEYISNIDSCRRLLAASRIILLRDSIARLDCGVQIIGRDDRTNRHRKPLEELVAEADASLPIIVLDHQPYDIAQSDRLGVDIHLSGHTHHGQVWPLSWLTDAMYDQSHGYRKWTTTHAYVSSGLSLWGPPIRIGTHSDMAIIEVK